MNRVIYSCAVIILSLNNVIARSLYSSRSSWVMVFISQFRHRRPTYHLALAPGRSPIPSLSYALAYV